MKSRLLLPDVVDAEMEMGREHGGGGEGGPELVLWKVSPQITIFNTI